MVEEVVKVRAADAGVCDVEEEVGRVDEFGEGAGEEGEGLRGGEDP